MRLGIVGSEKAKFTPATEAKARALIRSLLSPGDIVVSGACHLGGIDIWAVEEARAMGCGVVEFPPATRNWTDGYKPRNLKIAEYSDEVVCITVKELPEGYTGMKFQLCYHCGTNAHVKSGGCYTVKQARRMGKTGRVLVIK
jgi:hypothetical protein